MNEKEKDAQESQASQKMQWNTSHVKIQTTHIATLFYQNFWADSWTESKNATKTFQFFTLLKQGGDFRSKAFPLLDPVKHRTVLPFVLKYYSLKTLKSHLSTQQAADWFVRAAIHHQDAEELQSLEEFTSLAPPLQRGSWDAAPHSAGGLLQFWGQEFEGKWTAVMFYSKTSHCKTSDSAADSRWLRCPGMGCGVGWTDGACDATMLCYPTSESELWHGSCSSVSIEFCTLHSFCSILCASCILQTDKTEIWCFQQKWEQFPLYYHQKRVTVVLDFH